MADVAAIVIAALIGLGMFVLCLWLMHQYDEHYGDD